MGAVDVFAKETVNRLGPGAYLVNIVPSVVVVLTSWALFTSRLFPWTAPLANVPPGAASVVQSAKDLGVSGGVVLVVTVLVVAVLLRPFQIAAVQFLEGYWRSRFGLRLVETLAVERHVRKFGMHEAWSKASEFGQPESDFKTVARHSRRERRRARKAARGRRALGTYPLDRAVFLPTSLGNVLRRAETTAGQRYGLDTVVMYPRLYPHLSEPLGNGLANRLDLMDTSCTFTIIFMAQAAISAPLVWRLDGWSLVPLAFLLFAAIAYRGARRVAERYAELLCTAFDLHRFDMLAKLHRKLPRTPETELIENEELSRFLAQGRPWPKESRRSWSYDHGT